MFPWVLSNKTTDVRINYYIFIPDAACILYVATIYGIMGCSLGRVSFLCRPRADPWVAPLISAGMGAKPAKPGQYDWSIRLVLFIDGIYNTA